MDLAHAVLSFAVLGALLTITPGLDTALVLRSAVTMGRGPAFATALGVGTGALTWGAAAAVGVSALLTASTVAYTVLRVAGAAYMIFLGARMIRAAVRAAPIEEAALAPAAPTWWSTFGKGLLTNLLNPKVGAFYIAVLPQFIPPDTSPLGVGLLLALVHDLEGLAWFALIIFGAQAARGVLARRAVRRSVDAGTGAVLLGFGLRLGLSSR
ncbi:lysine transporter LysE [Actinoplanes ianthinogenes]|uniref:Threonine transporter RhtB n=1 Tax=Actinoplanes ianthinogenes TaxID=122358 RepID=A0ABM7LY76_9ACTN|nr:LysE family translocator [Actinoplanes ianthinogenes]BCJ44264.1 threonine transporter RhtB [Actinoplanes ianthinogenes]GGQ96907.1 lysine transporter LysE [Actinoplanes ianthinogenes]